jgi:hypothetical protein
VISCSIRWIGLLWIDFALRDAVVDTEWTLDCIIKITKGPRGVIYVFTTLLYRLLYKSIYNVINQNIHINEENISVSVTDDQDATCAFDQLYITNVLLMR